MEGGRQRYTWVVLVTKLCPAILNPWTVAHHAPLSVEEARILSQARILKWFTICFSRGSS